MFKRVPSAGTKADKRYAADCSNVQPHYWQYSHNSSLGKNEWLRLPQLHCLCNCLLIQYKAETGLILRIFRNQKKKVQSY
ncbi:MAG: hypothetical protein JWQ09_4606 [Segetibacter sp.]|nr:hypothetical protein [Segetibacter sp.]